MKIFDVLKIKVPTPIREDKSGFRHEVKLWVRRTVRDFWFKDQMGITPVALSRAIGCDRMELHRFLRNETINGPKDAICQKLSNLRKPLETRKLIFTRKIGAIWLDGETGFHHISPLSPIKDWTLFTRCSSCFGNQFLPIMIAKKEHAACYFCLPPSQYASVGGKLLRRSLIAEAASQMGYA